MLVKSLELLSHLVLFGEESDGKEKMWVGEMLRLARFLKKREKEGEGLTFVEYMEFVLPSEEVDEALRFVSAVGEFAFC